MKTYNQIVKTLEDFSKSHLQINTFYNGQVWNFQAKENVYPALLLVPNTSSIEKGRIVLQFGVLILDLINGDRSNVNEVYSDTLSIMSDMVSYLSDNFDDNGFYLIDDSINIEPLEEEFDDIVGGWIATIGIEFRYGGSNCGLPIE